MAQQDGRSKFGDAVQKALLAPIGNISPAEAEQRHYATLDDQPMAA